MPCLTCGPLVTTATAAPIRSAVKIISVRRRRMAVAFDGRRPRDRLRLRLRGPGRALAPPDRVDRALAAPAPDRRCAVMLLKAPSWQARRTARARDPPASRRC